MSEKILFNPETKEQRELLSVEALETEMEAKRTELAAALAHVKELRDAWDAARASGDKAANDVAWQSWKAGRDAYAKLVEAVAAYEQERGKLVSLPDGTYSVEMYFVHSKKNEPVTKTERIFAEKRGAYIGNTLPEVWGAISMLGIHNFGFSPEPARQADCRYTLKGPDNFAYHSSVLVDASGHIIRRADDVR